MYNSTLKRKTPLKAKTALKAKTSLKCYSTLRSNKSLRQCSIDKQKAAGGHSVVKSTTKRRKSKEPFKSIFTDDLSTCVITGCKEGYFGSVYHKVHVHHIFGAANKRVSEKYHFLIPLRDDWHNMSDYGVHFNKDFDLLLKRLCQTYYLLHYGTKEDFIREFGMWW